ncbi:hypothetical protein CTRI78_v003883 [Colletotrichum trifolii]|uniref:F-box domain-containing protein n=1 Tax=Colletotrichum trifolii TaxID=5466 RepID=A0A4R8RIB8_COLTR|nr:hypothetical protein CTRI78_v003883 [Colletotrichum trifolii]
MMDSSSPVLPQLPIELVQLIVSRTSHSTKLAARLVSRSFYAMVTPEAFRQLRLDSKSCDRFRKIALHPDLRRHVREVTCDGKFDFRRIEPSTTTVSVTELFLETLPYLRHFRGLKILNLDFKRGWDYPISSQDNGGFRIRYGFRHWVMLVAFHAVLGVRGLEGKEEGSSFFNTSSGSLCKLAASLGMLDAKYWSFLQKERPPIRLEQLTITNLARVHEEDLAASEHQSEDVQLLDYSIWPAFQQMMSLPSLKHLNLMVSPDNIKYGDRHEYIEPLLYEPSSQFDFMARDIEALFTPSLARNLTVLSLCYDELWGYYPRFDLRKINPGNGPGSGFPQLKVLSLMRYCFSHKWQLEWIASLGNCGLEELYLDECVLVTLVWCSVGPAPEEMSYDYFEDSQRHPIAGSKHGYLPHAWRGGYEQDTWAPYYDSNLRWHQFFDHWRSSMHSLRIFKMGSTDTHTFWSKVKMPTHWRTNAPPRTAAPAAHFFSLNKNDIHRRFHDEDFRRGIRMSELKVPFYVQFFPEPLDGAFHDVRPWVFGPPLSPAPGTVSQNEEVGQALQERDMDALEMLREEVRQRRLGLI